MIIRTPCEADSCTGSISFRPAKGSTKPISGQCDACGGHFELSAGSIRACVTESDPATT